MEVFEIGDEGGTLGSLGDLLRQLKGLKGSKNDSFEEIDSFLVETLEQTSYPTTITIQTTRVSGGADVQSLCFYMKQGCDTGVVTATPRRSQRLGT